MQRGGIISPDEIERIEREVTSEIARCFEFAKSSSFPTRPDWETLNSNPESPMADKLLAEVELAEFDAQQDSPQPKGY